MLCEVSLHLVLSLSFMLNQLLADTKEAAISLQKQVKDFKITNIPG
jgi:hypothetical protein